ncbi:hypothetical protein HN592_04195 [Candidatus Woesearchaeota archaeon]|jgi:FlaG/FlaF family flagellin (archaellin)|nr:hypothetical protein [Candidatus Woesearchaeota archaeon]MBT4368413.1 hypothetical protein [Candidatus Woesearchaeota archaeon]MBT4712902.1 hypothetical protein [Candidatus Woesearchaeota archaeon]MBT6639814.1 hypothetical protein [Candidatus Woesearchaeota archaeon]MBT7133986.1 hypothetical protein [Candidatus Woesearchaeota archaeon]
MNERAVSPLIATIFLIAVSVALGSIVMSLGQDYVSQADPLSASCSEVSYDLKRVNYNQNTNELKIIVDNGDFQIDGFLIKLFDESYTEGYSERISQTILPYEVGVMNLLIDTQKISSVYEVKVIPQIGSSICDSTFRQVDQSSPLFVMQ